MEGVGCSLGLLGRYIGILWVVDCILSGVPRFSLTSCKIFRAVGLSKEPKLWIQSGVIGQV